MAYAQDRGSGIYMIRNIVTGRVYVGQAVNVDRRIKTHFAHLRRGVHCNVRLQRSFAKYGQEAFSSAVLEMCGVDELTSKEQHHIDRVGLPMLYNIAPEAGSVRGIKCSEEKRAAISAARKGKKLSDEHRLKLSLAKSGKAPLMTEERRLRIVFGAKNMAPEKRAKIVAAVRAARLGSKHSEESKRKMLAGSLGRIHSEAEKMKRAASVRAYHAARRAANG